MNKSKEINLSCLLLTVHSLPAAFPGRADQPLLSHMQPWMPLPEARSGRASSASGSAYRSQQLLGTLVKGKDSVGGQTEETYH